MSRPGGHWDDHCPSGPRGGGGPSRGPGRAAVGGGDPAAADNSRRCVPAPLGGGPVGPAVDADTEVSSDG
jgi:hypothetical protein